MKVTKNLQTAKVYEGSVIAVPDGYEFLQFIMGLDSQGYTIIHAVFQECISLKEWQEERNAEFWKRRKAYEEEMKKKLNEEIKKLKLEETFSELIQKFNIGDKVYYYQPNAWKDSNPGEHKERIKYFTINSIVLESSQVSLKGKDEDESYGSTWLVVRSWGEREKATEVYATEVEAIKATKKIHDEAVNAYKKYEATKDARKKKELEKQEAEILRRAEEIKKKKAT